jgi:hypothetical protein
MSGNNGIYDIYSRRQPVRQTQNLEPRTPNPNPIRFLTCRAVER